MSLQQMNRCIAQFGKRQKAFMRGENRALLRSILFDVPRRSSIGWYCYYKKAPGFLRELTRQMPPEEIGRRMRRLCSRPYYLQLSILMCSYFGARQQLILDQGLRHGEPFPDENPDDALFVVDFWRRACRAYRSDGQVFPGADEQGQAVLPQSDIELLDSQLLPKTAETHQRLRRMAATLELYVFILHGEQRDGLFAHGPYELGDGSQLVALEFTDLQNDYLPWADTKARNPFPNLALVRRVRGVHMHFDMFGGIRWDVPDFEAFVEAEGLFTRNANGGIEAVPPERVAEIESSAAAAQNELFLNAAEWSPRYKAEYGVHLFANHLLPFFDLLPGENDWGERITTAFADAASGVLDGLLEQQDPPSIWPFMATTDEEYFWPVVENHRQAT
jgi:hypothetical protein